VYVHDQQGSEVLRRPHTAPNRSVRNADRRRCARPAIRFCLARWAAWRIPPRLTGRLAPSKASALAPDLTLGVAVRLPVIVGGVKASSCLAQNLPFVHGCTQTIARREHVIPFSTFSRTVASGPRALLVRRSVYQAISFPCCAVRPASLDVCRAAGRRGLFPAPRLDAALLSRMIRMKPSASWPQRSI